MFSKKATKIDKIFTVNLTLCSKCQIDGEDFVKFCGLLRKHKLYFKLLTTSEPDNLGSLIDYVDKFWASFDHDFQSLTFISDETGQT